MSMSSAEATPSSSIRIASSAIATPSREDAKPGESVTVIAVLPNASTQSCALVTVAASVLVPTTISTSWLAGTGLKKCKPRNFSGRTKLAEDKIAQAESQAIQEVRSLSADVAISAAERLLSSKVKGAAGSALVAKSISDVKTRLN